MELETCKLNFRADLLREAIRSNGLSQKKLSEKLGLNDKTISQKMNGVTQWTLSEIQQISSILKGLDVNTVFCLKKYEQSAVTLCSLGKLFMFFTSRFCL